MQPGWRATSLAGLVLLVAFHVLGEAGSQSATTAHTIFVAAIEATGATTADKLDPPEVDPTNLSKGYGFKPPGTDPRAPRRWEVSSFLFTPGFVAVHRGDHVTLTVFVVNGDEHEVRIVAPDGKTVIAPALLKRGQEYRVTFVAEHAGTYHLSCARHAPTMTTAILSLSR